jgi:16S rRNA C1402 (ribose-2'-O) methylase RsmI
MHTKHLVVRVRGPKLTSALQTLSTCYAVICKIKHETVEVVLAYARKSPFISIEMHEQRNQCGTLIPVVERVIAT